MLTRLIQIAVVVTAASATGCTDREAARQAHLARGNQLYEKGQTREAIIEYRNAVRADATFGEARFRLALALAQAGEPGPALAEAVRAADLMPDRVDAQLYAGNLLLAAGRYAEAKARANHVLEKDLRNVEALILLGNANAGLRDFDEAVKELERAAALSRDQPQALAALGSVQRLRGDVTAAEQAFRNALRVAPRSVEAHLALANFYWSTGAFPQVEETLKAALAIDPQRATTHRALGLFYATAGRYTEAEPHLLKLAALAPDDPGPRFGLADIYSATGRPEHAHKILEPLLKNERIYALALARLAQVDFEAGRKDAAYARLDDGARRYPKDAEIRTMRARLLLADRRFSEAESEARAALEIEAKRYEPQYVLGTALLEQNRVDEALPPLREAAGLLPRAPAPKIQIARAHLARGEVDQALQFAQEALDLEPRSALARLLLARIHVQRRDAAKAREVLEPVARIAPNSSEVQTLMGRAALVDNDIVGARRAFTRAADLDPSSMEALSGLIDVELRSGQPARALGLLDRQAGKSGENPEFLLLAARTYLAVKDEARAEQVLKQAIEVAPHRMEAYEQLARLYFTQRRLDEALARFEHLARQQPKAVGPATMVGVIQILQGKRKEAQETYERLVQANPEAPIAANNLAMLYLEGGGNVDVALNLAQAAKRALPLDPDVNDTLGLAYYKKGLGSLAVSALEVSTRMNPTNPTYWLHLGQAHVLAGDKAKARAAFERALQLDPGFAGAEEARKALAELGRSPS